MLLHSPVLNTIEVLRRSKVGTIMLFIHVQFWFGGLFWLVWGSVRGQRGGVSCALCAGVDGITSMSVQLSFSNINTVYHSPVLNTIDVLRRSGRVQHVSFVQELTAAPLSMGVQTRPWAVRCCVRLVSLVLQACFWSACI